MKNICCNSCHRSPRNPAPAGHAAQARRLAGLGRGLLERARLLLGAVRLQVPLRRLLRRLLPRFLHQRRRQKLHQTDHRCKKLLEKVNVGRHCFIKLLHNNSLWQFLLNTECQNWELRRVYLHGELLLICECEL